MHLTISIVATGLTIMLAAHYINNIETQAASYTTQHKNACVCGVSRQL